MAKGTAVINWEEELAAQAKVSMGMEASTSTGQFFSLKSGVLSFNDAQVPNNEMAVVICDSILENVFYEGAYDPDAIQGPSCFAFGRDDAQMKPHTIVIQAGNSMTGAAGLCQGCEKNEWGSADTGRGKACRNTRRLALIPAGTFDRVGKFQAFKEEDHFKTTPLAFMKLPVTSVKAYAAYVKQLGAVLKRPPHGVVTKIKIVPDQKNQFSVTFEAIMTIPNNLMSSVMDRHNEATQKIDEPYQINDGSEPVKKKSKAAQKPSGKSGGRRY